MARHMRDLARLLETMAGYDPRSPLSLDDLPAGWSTALQPKAQGLRVGWLGDLNGYLPMEPGILQACEQGLQKLTDLGAHVEPVAPHFSPEAVWETWLAWRRVLTASRIAPMVERDRDACKPEAVWEYEQAQGMTATAFLRASTERTVFLQQMLQHFDTEAIHALVAPRPHLELSGDQDPGTPLDGVETLENKVGQMYRLYGKPDNFRSVVWAKTGHEYLPEMRDRMIAWFEKHLPVRL